MKGSVEEYERGRRGVCMFIQSVSLLQTNSGDVSDKIRVLLATLHDALLGDASRVVGLSTSLLSNDMLASCAMLLPQLCDPM